MTRPFTTRIWSVVFLSVGLLTAASAVAANWESPRPLGVVTAKAAATVMEQTRTARHWLATHPRQAKTAGIALLALSTSLGAGLLVGRRIGRRARRGHGLPWRQVTQLARRGQPVDSIARATSLPRDAVRALLVPVDVEPEFARGKTFRKEAPGPSRARQ